MSNKQDETISVPDSEDYDQLDFADLLNIDAEIVDYGVLEDEYEDTTFIESSELTVNSTNYVSNNVITKHAVISIVDCEKYPWYYNKNKTQRNNHEPITDNNIESGMVNSKSPLTISDSPNSLNSVSIINNTIKHQKDAKYSRLIDYITATKKSLREDRELDKALKQRNTEVIDLKRNKGLIGIKIKPKIVNGPMNDNESKQKHECIKRVVKNNKKEDKINNNNADVKDLPKNVTNSQKYHKNIDPKRKIKIHNVFTITSNKEMVTTIIDSHTKKLAKNDKIFNSSEKLRKYKNKIIDITENKMVCKKHKSNETLQNENQAEMEKHGKNNKKEEKINANETIYNYTTEQNNQKLENNKINTKSKTEKHKNEYLKKRDWKRNKNQTPMKDTKLNSKIAEVPNKFINEKATTVEVQNVPNVTKDYNLPETKINKLGTATNVAQNITAPNPAVPTESNFKIYSHRVKSPSDELKRKVIILKKNQNYLPCNKNTKDAQKPTSIDYQSVNFNNVTKINDNFHALPHQNFPLSKKCDVLDNSFYESQQMNRKDNTKDFANMTPSSKPRITQNLLLNQNQNKSIETIITDRNAAGYVEMAGTKESILHDSNVPRVLFPRPSQPVVRPISPSYHYFRLPILLPPSVAPTELRRMPWQGVQTPPRCGLQMGNGSYRSPSTPSRNIAELNCIQSFTNGNVLTMGNNMPPGICDVRPKVRFRYPPPPIPPKPPATPYPYDSVIGRNHEGVVKKINLTPAAGQTLTKANVTDSEANLMTVPESARYITASSESQKNGSFQFQKFEDTTSQLKRPIHLVKCQEKLYRPGPLSKKIKQNMKSDTNLTTVHSNNGYSAPLLPIPTYDTFFNNFANKTSKQPKGFLNSFEEHLKQSSNRKRISFGEYKKRGGV